MCRARVTLLCSLSVLGLVMGLPHVPSDVEVAMLLGNKEIHDEQAARLLQLQSRLVGTQEEHPDIGLSTPDMITRRGYPVEIHYVTTADNFILQMHRIPNPGKQVVFLQHGLLCASSDWVMMGPEAGLAYIMYDAGYDVWMGNARGNTYSRNHTFLNPDTDSEFWKFTWHQMGIYDMPAEIDYVLTQTGETQVSYVAHSMGTTMFWVMCSEKPKYNEKIKQMHALAPVAFMSHVRSPLRLLAPFVTQIEWISSMMGVDEFLPSSDFFTFMGQQLCSDQSLFQGLCTNILFLIVGFDSQQLNETSLPVIMSHTPAGASTKTILHYTQEITSERFCQYDYGWFDNLEIYGEPEPPRYALEKVTAPVYLHYSENDWMAGVKDVNELYSKLPNGKANIVVPHPPFNHLDFLWAIDVKTLLYDTVLALLENPLP